MKAIDFACKLLTRIYQGDLSPVATQVILAVAAGLETAPDISLLTNLTQSTCTGTLRALEKSRLLVCVSRTGGIFRLSQAGKDYVCQLFSFATPQFPCVKSDT